MVSTADQASERDSPLVGQELHAPVEPTRDAIIGLDRDGTITSWSPGAEQVYGYTAAEIVGRTFAPLVPADALPDFASRLERVWQGEFLEPYETARVRKDGAVIDVIATVSPICNRDGAVVSAAVIARDVTRRKRLEQQRDDLLASERAARLEAELFARRMERLQALSVMLARPISVEEITRVVVEQVLPGLGAAAGSVGLLSEDGTAVDLVQTLGYPEEMVAALGHSPLNSATPITDAVRTGRPVWRNGASAGAARRRYPDYERSNPGYPSGAAVPLIADGRALGAIGLSFNELHIFTEEERGFLQSLAAQCAQAVARAHALAAERAGREQLSALLGGVADGVVVQDEHGRFLYANDAAARLAGFATAVEYLALPASNILERFSVRDENGHTFPSQLLPAQRALHGEEAPEMVLQFHRLDTGDVRWSHTRSRAVKGAKGELLAISIFHDITEERQGEQRLRFLAAAGAELANSLEVGDTLASIARLAAETVADWAVVFIGSSPFDVEQIAVAHRDPARQALVEALYEQYPPQQEPTSRLRTAMETGVSALALGMSDEELAGRAVDAEHFRMMRELGLTSCLYVPLRVRGRILGALGLIAATTHRIFSPQDQSVAEEIARRAALALDNARLYAEAREAIRTRDEFLSIASHELRTPVTALSGTAQLLQRLRSRGQLDQARVDRGLDQIVQSSARLVTLTEDLLDVSRLQTGHFELHLESLDLCHFLDELSERYSERLDGRHTLSFDVGTSPCLVFGDPGRLEQVIENLLTNALKYSPEGGTVAVELVAEPSGKGVQVNVRDQGIGLMPGAEQTIFSPFGRAPNALARQIPGLGLGLYICRQIIERHRGRIWAESPGEGQGTTLSLWLPVP